jgi:hypothetical protein
MSCLLSRLFLFRLLLIAPLSACGSADESAASDAGHAAACEIDGTTYPSGSRNIQRRGEGCSACSCEDGEVHCTFGVCTTGQGICTVDGVSYLSGTVFHKADGISECVCKNGMVECYPRCSDEPGCEKACVVDGKSYPSRTPAIPGPNGCGSCTCLDGSLSCDPEICEPERRCTVNGVSYVSGSSFVPAPDGCNTCTCDDGELTSCTEFACLLACVVDGKTYASGEDGFKDPFSCNECACDNGQLVCADADCPENECPPHSIPGRNCAQCGPVGNCEAYEFGCMTVCDRDDQCPLGTARDWCVEGICVSLCG